MSYENVFNMVKAALHVPNCRLCEMRLAEWSKDHKESSSVFPKPRVSLATNNIDGMSFPVCMEHASQILSTRKRREPEPVQETPVADENNITMPEDLKTTVDNNRIKLEARIITKYYLKDLQTLFNVASALMEEIPLRFDNDFSLAVRQMDPTHIALLQASVKPVDFDGSVNEINRDFVINVKPMKNMLKRRRAEDVELIKEGDNIQVKYRDPELIYTIQSLYNPLDSGESFTWCPLPKVETTVSLEIERKALLKALNDAKAQDDSLNSSDKFKMKVTSTSKELFIQVDNWSNKTSFKQSIETAMLEIKEEGEIQNSYNLKLMMNVLKAMQGDYIRMEFARTQPIKVYDIGKNDSSIIFWLAPCIDDDQPTTYQTKKTDVKEEAAKEESEEEEDTEDTEEDVEEEEDTEEDTEDTEEEEEDTSTSDADLEDTDDSKEKTAEEK